MSIAETECKTTKEEVTKVTGVVVQYTQEWKYYTNIIETIKKEIDEAEKSKLKTGEEDKEEEEEGADKKKEEKKEEKKEGEEKEEKEEKKEPKKEKKEVPTKSSTSNEVKQIEKQAEQHDSVNKKLQ